MNGSTSDFEHQLQQLTPANCDELLPDTFFRAGWEACQAQSPTARTVEPHRRLPRSFGAGLLCGLILSVGIMVLPSSMNSANDQSAAVTGVPDADPMTMMSQSDERIAQDESLQEREQPQNEWKNLVADLSPWSFSGHDRSEQLTPLAVRPLSPVARHYWSQIVVAEPQSWRGGDDEFTESTDGRLQLRSFPATEKVFEEIL